MSWTPDDVAPFWGTEEASDVRERWTICMTPGCETPGPFVAGVDDPEVWHTGCSTPRFVEVVLASLLAQERARSEMAKARLDEALDLERRASSREDFVEHALNWYIGFVDEAHAALSDPPTKPTGEET